jgi:hypothetical protein
MNTLGYKVGDRVILHGIVAGKIIGFREPNSILSFTPADAHVQYGRRKEWISCGSDSITLNTQPEEKKTRKPSKKTS